MNPIVVIPGIAFLLCVVLHLAALKLFPLFGLLDFPERYGLSRPRIPYPTGLLAILCFLAFFTTLAVPGMQSSGVIAGILLLGIVTFIDDRAPVPVWLRIGAQIAAALIIFASGTRIYTLTNPLEGIPGMPDIVKLDTKDIVVPIFGALPVWSGIFTVLWLGLTINALNWFDGIRGQVSTISTIGFLVIGFLSLSDRVDQPELALLSFILAAIALSALLFDFPPGRVLLGDTGAMFFGLMLGVLTIYAGGKVATAFLVLGVPLIDSAIVVARRVLRGKSIFRGDAKDEHLHHRLLARGWSPVQVILLTAALGALFGVGALFLSTRGKFVVALILFLVMLGLSWYSRSQSARKS